MLRFLFLLLVLIPSIVDAGTITRPTKSFSGTSFINGVVPQAGDFNGDADTIYGEFNGNISNVNISASAAIAASKINPDGFVTNIRTVNAAPCKILDENDQSADLRRWAICSAGGQFQLGTYSDVGALQNNWLTITRANGGFTLGGTSGTNTVNGATTFNQTVTFSSGTSLLPSGAVMQYMGTTAPSGWLLMDGASNSCTGASSVNASLCTQLVSLFGTVNYKGSALGTFTVDTSSNEIIHTAHGKTTGDRVHFSTTTTLPIPLSATTVYCIISTTTDRYKISGTCGGAETDITSTGSGTHSDYFNFLVPDARGRNALGQGAGAGLTNRVLGDTGGEETHILTETEMPSHTHSLTNGSSVIRNATGGGAGAAAGSDKHSFTVSAAATGGDAAHAVMDPFLVMTFIIKL